MAENVKMNVHKNTSDFKRPIKPYKVAFAGVYSVGKTSLFRRINGQHFTEEKPPSQENSTYDLIFPEENVVIPVRLINLLLVSRLWREFSLRIVFDCD